MTFAKMRAGLVERGLITADFKLTPAGDRYCDELLDRLQAARAARPDGRPRKRWQMAWPHERRGVDGAVNSGVSPSP